MGFAALNPSTNPLPQKVTDPVNPSETKLGDQWSDLWPQATAHALP
jgi:hypothetical protein